MKLKNSYLANQRLLTELRPIKRYRNQQNIEQQEQLSQRIERIYLYHCLNLPSNKQST